MAPLLDDSSATAARDGTPLPRVLIIGAGSRGSAYARAVTDSGLGKVHAVAEPVDFKRTQLGMRYIWQDGKPSPEQEFDNWKDFISYELQRRKDEASGIPVPPGVDAAFVCVRDDLHMPVVTALAPLALHIMCEKPLATTLEDCLAIPRTLSAHPQRVFAIGHVLRYSPHNMLLRHLLLEKKVVGDVLSLEHTEPVGWWHFSHSYVRGHWRKESASGPSLLTKSCHDIDFILWMLCSPAPGDRNGPHLPSNLTSTGSLKQFRKSNKPKDAGTATNCLSCPIEDSCMYSAKRIYVDKHLSKGKALWPVEIVNPEIDHLLRTEGQEKAQAILTKSLSEDYNAQTASVADIESRPWFGRCVWESDNDVCDDQLVTIDFEEIPGKNPKSAVFHMIAQTLAQCERRGRIYGTKGEIEYDSKKITVHDFTTDTTEIHHPHVPTNSHHGGGDQGLTEQFMKAVRAAMSGSMTVDEAQAEYLGCTLEDVVRSHAAVFAADEARVDGKVVRWSEWWKRRVDPLL